MVQPDKMIWRASEKDKPDLFSNLSAQIDHVSKQVRSLAIIEDDKNIRIHLADQIRLHIDVDRLVEFDNAENALQQLSVDPVEIALFDIKLPGMNGIECIRRLKLIHPRMQMMVLTVYDNTDLVFDALKAGASSYILKVQHRKRSLKASMNYMKEVHRSAARSQEK